MNPSKPRVHYIQGNKDHYNKEMDLYLKPGDLGRDGIEGGLEQQSAAKNWNLENKSCDQRHTKTLQVGSSIFPTLN